MVNVQHGSLGALKHDTPAIAQDFVQQAARVGDEGPDQLSRGSVVVVHLRRIQRVSTKQRVGYGVLLRAGSLNVGLQELRVQQVDDPQSAAGHFVFVGWADAAAGSANFLTPRRTLGGQFDHAVIGQNDLRTIRHKKLPIDGNAQVAQLGYFLEKGNRIQNHTVPDDALAARTQHTARNQLQYKLLPANDDRVPGIMSAGVACHGGEPLAEHVHNFALAFVAPLGAQHNRRLRSHVDSVPTE